jgi:hypothetical protein
MVATGGDITYSNGYTVHTFTSNGFFTVNSINTDTNADVYIAMCGGGGSSGMGMATGSAYIITDRLPGGGGGGGEALMANLTVNDFAVTSYSATVGAGGYYTGTLPNAIPQPGGNTSFKGYLTQGGGPGGSWNLPAPSGFITGGGGGSMVRGANTIEDFHIVGSSPTPENPTGAPIDQPLYGTWFNGSIYGELYYKSELPEVYSTWNNVTTGLPKIFANAFNAAGLRISNEGGNGTAFEGGNAAVGSLAFDCASGPQPITSCTTLLSLVAPGGGAGCQGNGYSGTGYWGLGDYLNTLQLVAGNGGKGLVVWGDDPSTTFNSISNRRFYEDYGSSNVVTMLGAGGGGGGASNTQFSSGGVASGINLQVSGIISNNTGSGGGGASSYSTDPENSTYSIARGGSGIVKIAYLNTIRQFSL